MDNEKQMFDMRVVSCSSASPEHPCGNILESNSDSLWISEPGIPQEFVLKVQYKQPPKTQIYPNENNIRVLGWSCYKQYVNNPKTMEISIAREDSSLAHDRETFTRWATLTALENAGTHLFSVTQIEGDPIFIKFKITETFGGAYDNKFILK